MGDHRAPRRSAPSRDVGVLAEQIEPLPVKLPQPLYSVPFLRTLGPQATRTGQQARYSGESSIVLLTPPVQSC